MKNEECSALGNEASLSLSELNRMVRDVISATMDRQYWVMAELSEAREVRGHMYMELIEKDERSNTPVARASAKCWHGAWSSIGPHFTRVTGQRIAPGMKVMLRVYPQFHENYGFSWIVTDINPEFTLGDMARKRREIINRLKAEGVLELNKQLPLSPFAQRIAVISAVGAAGYGDFRHQLENNSYGFRFETMLFPATMQGEGVEASVIGELNKINRLAELFDCVVIIRGGGATSDLSGFDTLALAENVANFPLPVITGIGHERDESVLDIVAHTSVKTPTAAAALLIDNLKRVSMLLDDAGHRISSVVESRMAMEALRLARLTANIPVLFSLYGERQRTAIGLLAERLRTGALRMVADGRHRLDMLERSLLPSAQRAITAAGHRVELLAQRAEALDPKHILRRGYSITLHNGRAVTDAAQLTTGDTITTRLSNGEIISTVESKKNAG